MVRMNGHFDGKVIVPDEPVNLPLNQRLRIDVEVVTPNIQANGTAIAEAFERAKKQFTKEDLDAMDAAHEECERIEESDEDLRL